jgi:hypothetical protein
VERLSTCRGQVPYPRALSWCLPAQIAGVKDRPDPDSMACSIVYSSLLLSGHQACVPARWHQAIYAFARGATSEGGHDVGGQRVREEAKRDVYTGEH